MNAKHYVSLEAAKKLKELGYNEECACFCCDNGWDGWNLIRENRYRKNEEMYPFECSCPTLLEAMDWLEKNFAFHISVYWRDGFWCYKTHFSWEELKIIDDNKEGVTDRNECMQKAIEKALELL